MILPDFFNNFFFPTNQYEKVMASIGKIRKEHQSNNILDFVSDQIKIRKKENHYDIYYYLIMESGQTITMTYTLEISDKEFLPTQICRELETCGEAIIEQKRW